MDKQNKIQKKKLFCWIIAGLTGIVVLLLLAVALVPVSSNSLKNSFNKKVNTRLKDVDFNAGKVTFYILRRIKLDKVNLSSKGLCLEADRVKIDYNFLKYFLRQGTPVHISLENAGLSITNSMVNGLLRASLPLGKNVAVEELSTFNNIDLDFKYAPKGISLGNLKANNKYLDIVGAGKCAPGKKIDYQIEIGLSPELTEIVANHAWYQYCLVPAKILDEAREEGVINIIIKGPYNNPKVLLNNIWLQPVKLNI